MAAGVHEPILIDVCGLLGLLVVIGFVVGSVTGISGNSVGPSGASQCLRL
jgi:hypothetical protein